MFNIFFKKKIKNNNNIFWCEIEGLKDENVLTKINSNNSSVQTPDDIFTLFGKSSKKLIIWRNGEKKIFGFIFNLKNLTLKDGSIENCFLDVGTPARGSGWLSIYLKIKGLEEFVYLYQEDNYNESCYKKLYDFRSSISKLILTKVKVIGGCDC